MKRKKMAGAFAGLGLALCQLALSPPQARGVACPGSGAQVQVTVQNPTNGTVPGVTLSGRIVPSTAYITCSGAATSYSTTVTLNLGTNNFTLPTSGGLDTGYWIHKISAGSGQVQYQKAPVLYGGAPVPTPTPGRNATANFTYFPNVIVVNQSDDNTNSGGCPSNCTFRNAITAANNTAGSLPVLIQFSSSLANPTTITMGQTAPMTLT